MAEPSDDSRDIEKLYEYGENSTKPKISPRLADLFRNQKDYEGIIAAANGSVKAKQLAAQMIPKFFKYFPELSEQALDQHLYLCEDEELGWLDSGGSVRVQAIRGLPLFCKDTPEHLAKIVDILGQLLIAGDNVERDAVHKALMSLLRQDVKSKLAPSDLEPLRVPWVTSTIMPQSLCVNGLTSFYLTVLSGSSFWPAYHPGRIGRHQDPCKVIFRNFYPSFLEMVTIAMQGVIAGKLCAAVLRTFHLKSCVKVVSLLETAGTLYASQHRMILLINAKALAGKYYISSLTALFKHIGSTDDRNAEDLSAWEGIREKVLCFIRDKVFPLKAELLKPKDEMERHITNLVKQLRSLNCSWTFEKPELIWAECSCRRVQELVEIIEGQADLDAQFNVSDGDHIDRFISCLQMALPFFMLRYLWKLQYYYLKNEKLDLLKNLAECSPYAKAQDSRQLLPSVVQLLKTPNTTNSLCGYKIVTGQPSDRLGEDFTEQYKDFTERLSTIEELAKAMNKKLTQGWRSTIKQMAAAKTEEEKETILVFEAATIYWRCPSLCIQKAPSFIGDQKISLSWKEVTKAATTSGAAATGQKRTANAANNGSGTNATKKGRGAGGLQNQLVNRAFEGHHSWLTSFILVIGPGLCFLRI
ncbi:hypothetical protein DH2020_033457 [Rehmannia glutinosa]|uniref:Uncharacterized protein n=1 Tax=Rehmannia glutinosa TaxID=99300 RepID=A0ABR0VF44_REHGL